jgi:predicted GIY-YIG superfamily endonuclease
MTTLGVHPLSPITHIRHAEERRRRRRLEARTTSMASWAYMLRCADGSFYVGCTTDLDTRIGQHVAGATGGYTAARLPVELVWAEEFQHIDDAIAVERQIKGWSRVKKLALIVGDFAAISSLASRARR